MFSPWVTVNYIVKRFTLWKAIEAICERKAQTFRLKRDLNPRALRQRCRHQRRKYIQAEVLQQLAFFSVRSWVWIPFTPDFFAGFFSQLLKGALPRGYCTAVLCQFCTEGSYYLVALPIHKMLVPSYENEQISPGSIKHNKSLVWRHTTVSIKLEKADPYRRFNRRQETVSMPKES